MQRRILTFLLIVCSVAAQAQDVRREQERQKKLSEEIALIDGRLEKTKSDQKSSTHALSLIQAKITARNKIIQSLGRQIESLDEQIREKEAAIKLLNLRLDTLEMYHSRLVLNAYKNRDYKVWFMYVMSAKDLGQGLRRWQYLNNISKEVNRQAVEIKSVKKEISVQKSDIETIKAQTERTRRDEQTERQSLKNEEGQMQKTISSLKKQEKQMKKELDTKKKEMASLEKKIQQLLKSEMSKKKDSSSEDNSFEGMRGKLPWPVSEPVVVAHFGTTTDPVLKVKVQNNGVDISTSEGCKATAVFAGEVKYVLAFPGYNTCVLLQHGQYFTFYCKLKDISVKVGDKVAAGTALGTVVKDSKGATVFHFQVWKGTEKQDPEKWLLQ
ncbi:MAG: peptidoglycan DD-metalloendopeptidase family protein [Bacteroidales bacterium]|nr:peptidoglycan DD-metalloendopeptidase family protein [Bacteroidales bacterium]